MAATKVKKDAHSQQSNNPESSKIKEQCSTLCLGSRSNIFSGKLENNWKIFSAEFNLQKTLHFVVINPYCCLCVLLSYLTLQFRWTGHKGTWKIFQWKSPLLSDISLFRQISPWITCIYWMYYILITLYFTTIISLCICTSQYEICLLL